ncbi:MAG: UxaA family hydrolase, partial [Firmicutes bacterium]|nr:UxaA family hydrolase [Bacillota bacterium]
MNVAVMLLHEADDVAVALRDIRAGEVVATGRAGTAPGGTALAVVQDVARGHKIALRALAQGQVVRKYGASIGRTKIPVAAGEWVHTHNLATGLAGVKTYEYRPEHSAPIVSSPVDTSLTDLAKRTFSGYVRPDG